MDRQRLFFWAVLILGTAGIAYLWLTEPPADSVAKPVSRTARNDIASRVLNAEIEAEPAFLIQQRTKLPEPGEFWATIEHPVFVPTRSSMVVDATHQEAILEPATAEEAIKPPEIRLVGTVVKSDASMALVTDQGNSFLRPLRVGEHIHGWKVSEIGAEELILTYGDSVHQLSILVQ